MLACYIVLYTGCRPNEASWMVCNVKGVQVNNKQWTKKDFPTLLYVPKQESKTDISYEWTL